MTEVCWLVDEVLQERAYETGYPSIGEVAKEQGYQVYQTKYIPFSKEPDPNIPFGPGSCVITYGTIQFCKQIEKFHGKGWCPGMYFNENVKNFHMFSCHLGDKLLSSNYLMLPYMEVVRRGQQHTPFFIKPNSGLKEFTGQVLTDSNFLEEINSLNKYEQVGPYTLCIIADVYDIKAEFRYVIVNKKVITGSEYRWDDVLDVRRDTHPAADKMAQEVADLEWQADTVYVCDVALLENDVAKVIELNAFSSSGLYACDTYKIVEAVSEAARKEYEGDIE